MRARHHTRFLASPPAAQPLPDRARLASCRDFAEFYPLYLAEHRNGVNRRLHFIGSTLALACLFLLVFTADPWWLAAAVGCGYGLAWIGHAAFERNRPATFSRPLFSLMADWVMWWQTLTRADRRP